MRQPTAPLKDAERAEDNVEGDEPDDEKGVADSLRAALKGAPRAAPACSRYERRRLGPIGTDGQQGAMQVRMVTVFFFFDVLEDRTDVVVRHGPRVSTEFVGDVELAGVHVSEEGREGALLLEQRGPAVLGGEAHPATTTLDELSEEAGVFTLFEEVVKEMGSLDRIGALIKGAEELPPAVRLGLGELAEGLDGTAATNEPAHGEQEPDEDLSKPDDHWPQRTGLVHASPLPRACPAALASDSVAGMESPHSQSDAPSSTERPAEARRAPRRWLRRTLLTLVTVLVAAVAIEVACRTVVPLSASAVRFLFLHQMSIERWEYLLADSEGDPLETREIEWIPTRQRNATWQEEPEEDRPPYDRIETAYTVKTNALGFRDVAFGKKRPETARVLVLGDSIGFGKGVSADERFSGRLKALAPAHIEVLNLGYPACGTVCSVAIAEEQAGLDPDLIVFQASGNDVDTAMAMKARGAETGLPSAPMRFLLRSRAVQLLTYWLFGDPKTAQMGVAVAAAAEIHGPTVDKLFTYAKARGVKVVVMAFPSSSGDFYADHVFQSCKRHPDVCLGGLEVALSPTGAATPKWLLDTADFTGLPSEGLNAMFPLAGWFQDIVHPNAAAHRLAGDQLATMLKSVWAGWFRGQRP